MSDATAHARTGLPGETSLFELMIGVSELTVYILHVHIIFLLMLACADSAKYVVSLYFFEYCMRVVLSIAFTFSSGCTPCSWV